MVELIGTLGGLTALFGTMVYFVLLGYVPLMVWSATRNIRRIREQLERLNDTLESKMTITKSGPLGL